MAALRFATTRLSGLRAAGRLQEMQHATIAPFLERELGPDYARLFADFEAESSDVRAWYADGSVMPRPIDALAPAAQEALRERLAQMIAEVLRLAERIAGESTQKANIARILTAATTFPPEDIWAAGDAPIIVNWGFHRHDVAAGVPRPIMMRIERRAAGTPPRGISQAPAAAQTQTSHAATIVVTPRRGLPTWLVPALLWIAFLVMVAASYRLLLPACALRGPLFAGLDSCPGAQAGLTAEGRELQGLVEQAELDLARRRGQCPVPSPAATPPNPVPTPATPQLRRDVERRLPRDAPHGEVEVSLIWNNSADLDLIVDCPNGERLWRASPDLAACGGHLLRDLNQAGQEQIDNPVEHAAWPHSPGGHFTIKVELFGYNAVAFGTEIPFTVAIKRPSGTQVVQGKVQGVHTVVTATEADL